VVVQCRPELARLVRSAKGVDSAVTADEPVPPVDCYAALMSLPATFGTTPETVPSSVPFIAADPADVSEWRRHLAVDRSQLKVGLAWGASPKPLPTRTTTLHALEPLARVPGVTFYSLQKGEHAKQATQPPEGMTLFDFSFGLNDFADTAALIENLDLVISVDTAVAHVAGALGKPVWLLLPFVADWRWMLDRAVTPWYPSMRIFRQAAPGDWAGVAERVATELADVLSPSPEHGGVANLELTAAELSDLIAAADAAAPTPSGAKTGRAELTILARLLPKLIASRDAMHGAGSSAPPPALQPPGNQFRR
jgi:hypothetical protein